MVTIAVSPTSHLLGEGSLEVGLNRAVCFHVFGFDLIEKSSEVTCITEKPPLPKVQPFNPLETEKDSLVLVPKSSSFRNQK